MIKRYDVYGDANWCGDPSTRKEENPAGVWVKWEDVEKLLEQKDALIRKLYLNQRLDVQGLEI